MVTNNYNLIFLDRISDLIRIKAINSPINAKLNVIINKGFIILVSIEEALNLLILAG